MKPTELKIRNLVYIIKRGYEVHLPIEIPMQILQIGLFNSDVLQADINPGKVKEFIKVPNCYLSPIPLTEQWLKDFGFEQKALRVFYIGINGLKLGIKLTSDDDGILMIRDRNGFDLGLNKEIKYVHQLQNLYFVLTDKELTKNKKIK